MLIERDRAAAFLFRPVSAFTVGWFRVLLALILAYAFWPRDLALGTWVADGSFASRAYTEVFLSAPYRVCMYGVLLWFASGWRPRAAGAVLFCLLLPHVFLAKGRVSRQMLITAVLLTSFLRSDPPWRRRQLGDLDAGPMWPIRLMQIQLTLLYAVNAVRKTTPEYLGGDVLAALSVARSNFLVDLSSGCMQFGPLAIPVWGLALTTVVIEYWLALGWWIPGCVRLTAAVGIGFHLFLKAFVIRIFMLDLAAMFFYLTFLLPFARDGAASASSVTGTREDTRGRGS
jgi:hypothetical protein